MRNVRIEKCGKGSFEGGGRIRGWEVSWKEMKYERWGGSGTVLD